ncbi:MAG: hypothetical protein P8H03_05460, partial [Emcibacteraceae bacterium]|nr:hypothetical protein [Emcibacteraceae bacterium]
MNLRITSHESNPLETKKSFFAHGPIIVLSHKSFNALENNQLKTTSQKSARLEIANDHISSSGFCNGEYLNVNSYVDRRFP